MATTASITIAQATGAAPLPVFVHARGSTLDYQDAGQAYYVWNFGDTSGDHNIIHGAGVFNAAHVYETAGTYTITLTVYERDGLGSEYSHSTSQQVSVSLFTGTTYYVDATGGDNGNGGTSESDAWETYEYAIGQISSSNTRILFKCGETFDTANGASITSSGTYAAPIICGQYGTGDDPVISHTGSSGAAMTLSGSAEGVRITDVDFEGDGGDDGITAGLIDNVLYLRTDVTGFDTAVTHGTTTALTNTDLFLFDCDLSTSGNLSSTVGTQALLSSANLAIVGCTMDDDAYTHVLSIANASGLFCADTSVSGPSDERNSAASACRLYNEATSVGLQVGQHTQYCVFLDCTFEGGRVPFRATPQVVGYEEYIDDVVLERCVLKHTPDDKLCQSSGMIAVSGQRHYIRNAEFHGPVGSANGTGELAFVKIEDHSASGISAPGTVEVKGCTAWGGGCVICALDAVYFVEIEDQNATDIVVEGNICHVTYSQATNTCLLKLAGPWIQDEITERANYFYCNTASMSSYVLRDFVGLTLAQWQTYGKGVGSSSGTDPALEDPDSEDFTLDSASPCLSNGIVTDGLWTDHVGNLRSASTVDVGAHSVLAIARGVVSGSATVSGWVASDYVRGTAVGVADVTGALVGDGALAGVAAGVGAATGSLNEHLLIYGSSAGVATVSGTLTADGDLAGVAAGLAASAALIQSLGHIRGTAVGGVAEEGDVMVAGILGGDGTLVGSSAGAGACRGTMFGPIEIAGSTAGTAGSTAALVGDGTLAGVIAGIATCLGHLIAENENIWGAAAGAATATGTMEADGALAGTSVGVAASAVVISADGKLVGVAAGMSACVLDFSIYHIIDVTVEVETTVDATLTAETAINETLTTEPVTQSLAAETAINKTLTADLTVDAELEIV